VLCLSKISGRIKNNLRLLPESAPKIKDARRRNITDYFQEMNILTADMKRLSGNIQEKYLAYINSGKCPLPTCEGVVIKISEDILRYKG